MQMSTDCMAADAAAASGRVEQTTSSARAVRRRLVYYFCGFDPRGATFYHQMYQTEALKQQQADGCRYTVSACHIDAQHAAHWDVEMHEDEQVTHTRYGYLIWDEQVHSHWSTSVSAILRQTFGFTAAYAHSGALWAMWKVCKRFFWSLLTPLLAFVITLIAATIAVFLVAWVARIVGAPSLWVVGCSALGGAGILWWGWRYARKLRLPWLICGFAFMLRWGRDGDASLDQRFDELASYVHQNLASNDADEVLIIGHCAGTVAAICFLDRLQQLRQQVGDNVFFPRVKLLTLGHVIPMIGMMRQADWFRMRLKTVAQADIPWLDYTSPADPLCCALVDPLRACGISRPPHAPDYRVRSSRFDKMFDEPSYAELRRDPFRIHFQYLRSTRKAVDNDFFKMTAGPDELETRIFHRA